MSPMPQDVAFLATSVQRRCHHIPCDNAELACTGGVDFCVATGRRCFSKSSSLSCAPERLGAEARHQKRPIFIILYLFK